MHKEAAEGGLDHILGPGLSPKQGVQPRLSQGHKPAGEALEDFRGGVLLAALKALEDLCERWLL
jgi:hypothetical protein